MSLDVTVSDYMCLYVPNMYVPACIVCLHEVSKYNYNSVLEQTHFIESWHYF